MNSRKERIYFDYAAGTPVDPRVLAAMRPYFSQKFGNPGSVHSFGQEALAAVDRSRETIGQAIGAEFREVIFTGSATEANNLAIRGAIKKWRSGADAGIPRIIVSAIEHESVLETARELEKEGVEVVYLPVDKDGTVNLRVLEESLDNRTVLVSVMYANNEMGAIQPVAKIAEIVKKFRASSVFPLFHTDAVQAFQFLDCNVEKLGVDMMTLSAHKIYGPKGIGALYLRRPMPAVTTGGGQEFGMRSGTENVPSIVGFAKACDAAAAVREKEAARIAALSDHFWRGIKNIFPKAERNGPVNGLPNILNVYFPGREAQDILTRLDLNGVAASSGSACRSRALEASYVIMALGYPKERAKASIRFSFGRPTAKSELDAALRVLGKILRK
jgi:cysteine desulfurase